MRFIVFQLSVSLINCELIKHPSNDIDIEKLEVYFRENAIMNWRLHFKIVSSVSRRSEISLNYNYSMKEFFSRQLWWRLVLDFECSIYIRIQQAAEIASFGVERFPIRRWIPFFALFKMRLSIFQTGVSLSNCESIKHPSNDIDIERLRSLSEKMLLWIGDCATYCLERPGKEWNIAQLQQFNVRIFF